MDVLNGNQAVARAVKQVNPHVAAFYPVLPVVGIIEDIASFAADGLIHTEILDMECGHGSMSACIGASAAGGRVFTASASQDLAASQDLLFTASSMRLPIVAAVSNRGVSTTVNIEADHSDSMAKRDCGWIQVFVEHPQEAYDSVIQAFKIAEHKDVRTPVMVCLDGFVTSHTAENIQVIEDDGDTAAFVGKAEFGDTVLDIDKPKTFSPPDAPDYYFEHRVNQARGMDNGRAVIKQIGKEFGDRFGRYYGFYESYKIDDAEFALVLMGSANGIAKDLVDRLRKQGERVGVLKLRIFRPFPMKELREALSNLKALAVLDRCLVPGSAGGPLYQEIRSALYDLPKRPAVFPYVYGLGGRDMTEAHLQEIVDRLKADYEIPGISGQETEFINLRGNKE